VLPALHRSGARRCGLVVNVKKEGEKTMTGFTRTKVRVEWTRETGRWDATVTYEMNLSASYGEARNYFGTAATPAAALSRAMGKATSRASMGARAASALREKARRAEAGARKEDSECVS
jgi:hypothetical protein